MKTLIVEDDRTSQIVLRKILEKYGECHAAEDGREALELFTKALDQGLPYDLVCLDYLMPEKDGEEVITEIRGMEEAGGISGDRSVKIIVITGIVDEDNAFAQLRKLCNAYLEKPIDRLRMTDILRGLGLVTDTRE